MSIDHFRLLIDFGLVVLIWMVQLVVYPSFKFYTPDGLLIWHSKYTRGITTVVMPLMLLQLGLVVLQISQSFDLYAIVSTVLLFPVWLITFQFFVPLHGKIATGKSNGKDLVRLTQRNWIRTLIWSLMFVVSLCYQMMAT